MPDLHIRRESSAARVEWQVTLRMADGDRQSKDTGLRTSRSRDVLTTTWNEYELSRLMLGTVQFGQPYGVANRTGQPDQAQVRAMISTALDGGVNCLDTAATYGTSEEVLGQALQELGVSDRLIIATKVRPLQPEELDDPRLAEQAIEASVATSRRRLGIDCLPVVLFHREADAQHLDVLDQLRRRGWLKHVGVSCGNQPGFVNSFSGIDRLSALQIPANLLDRRHQAQGAFETAAINGIAVFIRSVYLQGLLVMPDGDIPSPLQHVTGLRRTLAGIADQAGMSLAELAVRCMLGQPGVTSVLVGVETEVQVRDNLALFAKGPLPADVQEAVHGLAPAVPEMLITPALWPQPANAGSNLATGDAGAPVDTPVDTPVDAPPLDDKPQVMPDSSN